MLSILYYMHDTNSSKYRMFTKNCPTEIFLISPFCSYRLKIFMAELQSYRDIMSPVEIKTFSSASACPPSRQ